MNRVRGGKRILGFGLAMMMAGGCSHGESAVDVDRDGYASDVDCNDSDWVISPGATEKCFDSVDNDCDGRIDIEDTDCQGGGGSGGAGGGAGGSGGQGGCVAEPDSNAGSICAGECGLRFTLYYNCNGSTHKGPWYEDTNDPDCNCPETSWYRCANNSATCAEYCASMGKTCAEACSITLDPPWTACSGVNLGTYETELGSCYFTGTCATPTPNCTNAWNTHCCCQ